MSEPKRICTRIINKHASAAAWNDASCTFAPEVGELIIYEPETTGAPAKIKIGALDASGNKTLAKNLPFIVTDYSGDISALNKLITDHTDESTLHVSTTERTNWNAAYAHSTAQHVAIDHKHSANDITSGALPVTRGGTGATTSAQAIINLGIEATAAELNVLKGITATTTELNYVDGVTSNIQDQLNGKAASSHNHAADNITSGTLSINRLPTITVAKGGTGATTAAGALVNLGLEASASEINVLKGITATTTELNYVDGVTDNIQTQLNGKAPSSHNHAAGNITSGTLSSDRLPTVPVSKGGTGATTAAQALVNLNAVAKSGDTMTGNLTLPKVVTSQGLAVTQTEGTSGYGIALYGNATPQTYGLWFGKTATFGTHGSVTSDWATYFGMNSGATTRGWVFRREDGCVASISGAGNLTLNGSAKIGNKVTMAYDSTNECLNFVFG